MASFNELVAKWSGQYKGYVGFVAGPNGQVGGGRLLQKNLSISKDGSFSWHVDFIGDFTGKLEPSEDNYYLFYLSSPSNPRYRWYFRQDENGDLRLAEKLVSLSNPAKYYLNGINYYLNSIDFSPSIPEQDTTQPTSPEVAPPEILDPSNPPAIDESDQVIDDPSLWPVNQTVQEPSSDSQNYFVEINDKNFYDFLDGLQIGKAVSVTFAGAFASESDIDRFTFDLIGKLTFEQRNKLGSDFVVQVNTSEGSVAKLGRADAEGGFDSSLTPRVGTPTGAFYLPGTGFGQNIYLQVSKASGDPTASYSTTLTFTRVDGVPTSHTPDIPTSPTPDLPPPVEEEGLKLINVSPLQNSTGLTKLDKIVFTFNKPIKKGVASLYLSNFAASKDAADSFIKLATYDAIVEGNAITYQLSTRQQEALVPGSTYYVEVIGNNMVYDLDGNKPFSPSPFELSFKPSSGLTPEGKPYLMSSAGKITFEPAPTGASPGTSSSSFDVSQSSYRLTRLDTLLGDKPLNGKEAAFLERYKVPGPYPFDSKKSLNGSENAIDFSVSIGSLKSIIAEVELASETKATSVVKVDPVKGAVFDFTYDPIAGLGVELLDKDNNGWVDTLKYHLQDGARGDVDGIVNGVIWDPVLLAEAPRRPIYRFHRHGVHFYTDNEAERDSVIKYSYGSSVTFNDLSANPQARDPIVGGWGYNYEGVAYQALDTQGTALYRFFSPSKGYHFVTTNSAEALAVIKNSVGSSYDLSNAQGQKLLDKGWGFQFEGNTYKVSTIAQTGMNNPVYRFFNGKKGVHFYSSSLTEATSVIANSLGAQYATEQWVTSTADALKQNPLSPTPSPLSSGWGYSFEGVAWYV